jgi:hypothetical protein
MDEFVEPLGMRVLIRKDESCLTTRGGIVLPDQAEIPTITGRVVEVRLQVERDADFSIASAVTAGLSWGFGAKTPDLFHGRCRCFRGGGTRSAKRSRHSNGDKSTPPLAPGRVDFGPRPGPTQLAALCRGST